MHDFNMVIMRKKPMIFSVTETDILKNYKEEDGSYKESLTNDVEGLLELYEATYLRVQE